MVKTMATFHMHARRFQGALSDPDAIYEFQSHRTNDLDEATTAAKELAEQGFTVVIYDHGHVPGVPGASDYRQIAKYWPDGRVEQDAAHPMAVREP